MVRFANGDILPSVLSIELRRDGEEKLAACRNLAFHPHVALHEADKALGNRQPQTGAAIFLSTRGDINKKDRKSTRLNSSH